MKMKYKLAGIAVACVVGIAVVWWLVSGISQSEVSLDVNQEIDLTPEQITSSEAIGEWEFLSVSAEELVDTTRKRLLMSNDELARIYYGTLRLGVNMQHTKPKWIETQGDSVTITLPPIGLLDKDFIDEARTKPFYESGTWNAEDREALYKKAYRMMTQHCMTKENLEAAEANGREQFRNMMLAMGYKHVIITFEK